MSKMNNSGQGQTPIAKYVLEVPPGVYPLNGDDPTQLPHPNSASSFNVGSRKEYIYPDFNRWVYHVEQDTIMQNYLQKGYYDSPSVGNELLSAKNAVHQYLRTEENKISNPAVGGNQVKTISNSCKLNLLSETVVKAIHYRRHCNKISMKSTYKPPPRVTLTEYKKEVWLKNLANPEIPLSRLSRTIPHGIRNKALLEQCCSKKVPITRAIWFVKCVGTNELRGLKRKNGPGMVANTSHSKLFEQNWIHDWTVQITEYIEKLTRDCFVTKGQDHVQWKENLNYILKLTSHLFMSELINTEVFLSWIVKFLKKICSDDRSEASNEYSTGDFKLIAVHLIVLKLFWLKIVKIDYLSKELSETLLTIYYKLQEGKVLTKELNSKLSQSFKFFILYLFYYNSSSFIISNKWLLLKPILKRIINLDDPRIAQQFDLIVYRNESLLMNLPDSDLNLSFESAFIKKLDQFKENRDIEHLSSLVFEESAGYRVESRDLAALEVKGAYYWAENLKLLLNWCLTRYRKDSTQQIYLTISVIKSHLRRCLTEDSKAIVKKVKAEIESVILDFFYTVNDTHSKAIYEDSKSIPIDIDKFLTLVNELHTMKAFTVSSYLRRLISSGIIYLPDAHSKTALHVLIIQNLPILGNAQCASILKTLVVEPNYRSPVEAEFTNAKQLLDVCLNGFVEKQIPNEIEYFSDLWTQLDHLNHGVKFLAADYFLKEFKRIVNESQKLITLDNTNISVTFQVFSHLDNQSKFFQEFLDLILINESRMINFYLETLYFISHIVMANACLVQSMIPAAKDAITTPQTSFPLIVKSIIINYNSLKDENLYDFTKVWNYFIDNLSPENSALIADLNLLISTKPQKKELSFENIENELRSINLSLTPDQFMNADRLRANELKLLEKFLALIQIEVSGGDAIDISVQTTIFDLLRILKNIDTEEFVDRIIEFCNTSILPSLYLDFDSYLKFTMKIVVYELISITDLVEVFSKESSISDNITGNFNHRLIWYLLLENKKNAGLTCYEATKFQLIRDEFRQQHIGRLLEFIRIGIIDSQTSFSITTSPENASSAIENQFVNSDDHLPTPVSNNVVTPLPMMGGDSVSNKNIFVYNFEEQLSILFNEVSFTNVNLLIDTILSKLNKDSILEIFNNLVLLDSKDIFSSKDLNKLVDVVNIFNLPLCQIILKLVWENELGANKSDEFKSVAIQDNLISMFKKLTKYTNATEGRDSCFNQLFSLLDPSLKLITLEACEIFFLRSEHFPHVYVSSGQESIVSHLNEIINNCSRAMPIDSSQNAIPLNDSSFFSLNAALEKLIYTAEKFHARVNDNPDAIDESHVIERERERTELSLSVSLILRIVLIHKYFLVKTILKRSHDVSKDSFIQNLGRLYKSKIVRRDSKLKNYLYDSLLSIELLFTETVAQEYRQQQQHDQLSPMAQSTGSPSTAFPSNIFNLPPLNAENILSPYLATLKFKDGLIDLVPPKKFYLVNEKEGVFREFAARPFDLIEEANPVPAMNNTSISLQLFNATTETKNPP